MILNNINSSLGRIRVRIAKREDAERIKTLINSAFRLAESFFVDEDRLDGKGVLKFLDTGKFLLAESEDLLLGCVYVEAHRLSAAAGGTLDRAFAGRGDEDQRLAIETDDAALGISDPKFSRAYLGLLAVDPAHQKFGLATLLMDAAEDHCRGLGAGFMDIKVVNLRKELFGYYRRRGYVEVGTSPFPAEVVSKLPCHFVEMSKPLHRH